MILHWELSRRTLEKALGAAGGAVTQARPEEPEEAHLERVAQENPKMYRVMLTKKIEMILIEQSANKHIEAWMYSAKTERMR